jgi:hypothetical protein
VSVPGRRPLRDPHRRRDRFAVRPRRHRTTESALADISKSIHAGHTGLPADLSDQTPVAIDAVMANLGGTVVRRSAADVQAEVAAGEEAQAEAKKKPREELHDARRKKQRKKSRRSSLN